MEGWSSERLKKERIIVSSGELMIMGVISPPTCQSDGLCCLCQSTTYRGNQFLHLPEDSSLRPPSLQSLPLFSSFCPVYFVLFPTSLTSAPFLASSSLVPTETITITSGKICTQGEPWANHYAPLSYLLSVLVNYASFLTLWYSMLHHIQSPDPSIICAQRVNMDQYLLYWLNTNSYHYSFVWLTQIALLS